MISLTFLHLILSIFKCKNYKLLKECSNVSIFVSVYFTGGSTEQLRHIRPIPKLTGSPTEYGQKTLDTRL